MHRYPRRSAALRIGIGLAAAALAVATWLPGPAAASTGWQVALKVHTGGPTADNGMTSVTAVAGNDAWAVGGRKSLTVPSSVQLRDIAPDGTNGEWFSATQSGPQAPVAEHRDLTGTWTSNPLPGSSGGQAFGMALIPGTTSLWATGFVPKSGGTGADAVIWGDGPGT